MHYGCQLVPFVIHNSGTNNISRNTFYLVIYHLSCKPHYVISFLICMIKNVNISKTKKRIFQKGKRHSSVFCKAVYIRSNYSSGHIRFNQFYRRYEIQKFSGLSPSMNVSLRHVPSALR